MLLAFGALVVVVVVWSVVVALLAAHDLRSARDDIHRISTRIGLDRTSLEAALQTDLRKVDRARGDLHQPGPTVFGWIPIVGRNITAERVVADASAEALRAGLTLSRSTRGLDNGTGGVDLNRLHAAAVGLDAAARRLAPALRRLQTTPVAWTVPPVTDGVRQARNQLLGLGPQIEHAAAGLNALGGVLGATGPRRVAVILMNNAELRGAGGLPSAYATGTIDNGRLELAPFQDVNTVARPPNRAQHVDSPADYHKTYGAYLADSTLWKNVTMSPDDPQTATVVAAVAAASLHVNPDVVVLCDVPAAAAVIAATGPITVDGQQVTGAELTRRLLVDAYGDGSLSEAKQQKRRQVLDEAATEAFARVRHQASSTPALLEALARSVAGRHLVVWSARPDEERQLIEARAAGSLTADASDIAMVTANNLGDGPSTGNKLDYYVHRSVQIDVRLHAHVAEVSQTVVLHNTAPTGLGPYVEGVSHPGSVRELLTIGAAREARLTGFTQDGQPVDVAVTAGPEGQRATVVLNLARGATTSYRMTYTVPVRRGHYSLLLVPQPLAAPAQLHLHISVTDAELGVVTGVQQPVHGVIDRTGSWDDVEQIDVPVHPLGGLRGWLHAFGHFWTHKV